MAGSVTSGDRTRSQDEIGVRAARAATGFKDLGVGRGDAVALVLRNDLPFLEASFASALLGAAAVPLNWHLTGDEAGYVLRDCEAKALIVHADLLPPLVEHLPGGLPVLVVRTPPEIAAAYGVGDEFLRAPTSLMDWDEWLETQAPWPHPPAQPPNTMVYTSGTTGRPKGVRREPFDPAILEGLARLVAQVFGLGPEVRTVVTGPMYHSAPNFFALNALRLGGHVWLQQRFDAEELLAWIERHRIETLHMVPIMFVRLLRLPPEVRKRYDLSSLRHVVHAAAPCPPDVKRAIIEWWGPIVHEYYGATESGPVVACTSREWVENPGTVGRPLPGATVRILDAAGAELPPLGVGEVYVRNDLFPDFTYHGRDAERREIERQGLVSVGDVGYLNERGFLFLCDRNRDMVISGGVNIYPAEIEAALLGMPGVQDCAVFGIPDAEYGEAVAAVIQPATDGDLTADAVRAWLRERIAGYKVPRVVEFRADLPREDSGKIFKRRLRDPYWEHAGRRI